MAFKDEFDAGAGAGKDDYFKVKEGANQIRVLDEPAVIVSRFEHKKFVGVCFEGAPYCTDLAEGEKLSRKWKAWIIDRADGKVKPYDMPYMVAKEIRGYLDNPEYSFKNFPMPFDITISVTKAGTFDAEYSVLPSRKDSEITPEEMAEYKTKTPAVELVDKAKNNAKKEWEDKHAIQLDEPTTAKTTGDYPAEKISPKDIPF